MNLSDLESATAPVSGMSPEDSDTIRKGVDWGTLRRLVAVVRAADVVRAHQGLHLGSAAHREALRRYDELRAKLDTP